MAIINSLAVGKARKSAGNLTFSTIKGRTIAREKPAYVRNPNTVKQRAQRKKMATIVACWRAFGYNTRHLFTVIPGYGSGYNEFVKRNIQFANEVQFDPISGIPYAVAGMQLGSGKYGSQALKLSLNSNDEMAIQVHDSQLRQELQVGDVIGSIVTLPNYNSFDIKTVEVTEQNIQALSNGQKIDVDETYEDGVLYAPFWYSSSRNLSSTPILYEKQS